MNKNKPLIYQNREKSLLNFNHRVLSFAENQKIPLIERFKYVCIVSSNLDEFYEIRYASLLEQDMNSKTTYTSDGYLISDLLDSIGAETKVLNDKIQKLLYRDIIPQLEKENIFLITDNKWPVHLDNWTLNLFRNHIQPLLTPIVINESRPFPNIINKALSYLAVLHNSEVPEKKLLSVIQVPHSVPRVYEVPSRIAQKTKSFIFLGALMRHYINRLFPGYIIINSYQFKLTRNSDLFISDDVNDLRIALKGKLTTRNLGNGVRLECSTRMPKEMVRFLGKQHHIRDDCIFPVRGPSNLFRHIGLLSDIKKPTLKYPPFVSFNPLKTCSNSIFEWISIKDRLLHHPYESFDPIINLINQAASDPDVLSIKQTIYRTGAHSPIMDGLINAVQNGKDVTVVIELMARFDEETNVHWSSELERVGAHIIHGHLNLKCHAKMILITRREFNIKTNKFHIVHYAHLGTGNYSPENAKSYTDFSLFTANKDICSDVHKVFAELAGSAKNNTLKFLWHSPKTNRANLIKLIKYETRLAKSSKHGGQIIAKVNSLIDHEIIDLLYKASNAGVIIDLIVRGMCSLRAGIPNLSENIKVHSVIGRFLEHHRIYFFGNNNDPKVFLSSADWMERNLSRRTEVTFPVLDLDLKNRVILEGLNMMALDKDNWKLMPDNNYLKRKNKKNELPAQIKLLKEIATSKIA
ncbi:MAG: polyphosphate kinase 1 [Methylophilales bacterium]|nr:polyphosphate kinase 1 [Methylophilales bacterium]